MTFEKELPTCHWRGQAPAVLVVAMLLQLLSSQRVEANDLYLQHASASIRLGNRFLQSVQHESGQFPADGFLVHPITSTALGTLALMKSGGSVDQAGISNGLSFLRGIAQDEPRRINDLALLILNLNVINSAHDRDRLNVLVQRLLEAQLPSGGWPHRIGEPVGDLSATEFALIALRDCVQVGYTIPSPVWERSQSFWTQVQNEDGGWPEFFNEADSAEKALPSRISGTLAGVAMLLCCEQEIASARATTAGEAITSMEESNSLQSGRRWLTQHCARSLQSEDDLQSGLDHLYGIERSFRPHGSLFPGEERWFRHHAVSLLKRQHRSQGFWPGNHQAISTSYALIALASGISPARATHLIMQGEGSSGIRIRSSRSLWNLNERFLGVRRTNRLDVPHELDFHFQEGSTSTQEPFLEAPMLVFTSLPEANFWPQDVERLKEYLDRGGLLVICPESTTDETRRAVKSLALRLADPYEGELTKVPDHHPVMSSMFQLPVDQVELWELNTGCRTVLLFSPQDLPVDWSVRPHLRTAKSELAVHIGMNMLAYAGETRVPSTPRLNRKPVNEALVNDPGLLRVGRVQISDQLPSPPDALKNLFEFVNQSAGSLVVPEATEVRLEDRQIADFPVLYWHGSQRFTLTPDQRHSLRQHLDRGGVLIADACCGSDEFDKSFRTAMEEVFPDQAMALIPANHELRRTSTLFDLSETVWHGGSNAPAPPEGTLPILEGIDHAGRYSVIYSRHDLSCAWQTSRRRHCPGYETPSALKIGTNLLIYSLKQELKAIPVSRSLDRTVR